MYNCSWVRTCCCGFDLRLGVKLIGFLGMLFAGYEIYRYSTAIIDVGDVGPEELPKNYKVVFNLSCTGLAFAIITELANLSLVLSAYGKNRHLAYPWVIWSIFWFIYTLGVAIFVYSASRKDVRLDRLEDAIPFIVPIIAVVCTAISIAIYFLYVVLSFIEILRRDPTALDEILPSNENDMTQDTQMQPVSYERFA